MKNKMSNEIRQKLSMDTKEKFLKVSKKLHKNLKSNYDIKLSVIQEQLSQALGFRNFTELEKLLSINEQNKDVLLESDSSSKVILEKNNLEKFLKNISSNALSNIVLPNSNNEFDIWKSRAIILVKLVSSLYYQIKGEDKFKSLELYKSLFLFDNLLKIFANIKQKSDFDAILYVDNKSIKVSFKYDDISMKSLNEYLFSLPGFFIFNQKQSVQVYEMHGFLTMQILRGIVELNILEKDICLMSKSWLDSEFFKKDKYYYNLMAELYLEIMNSRDIFSKYKADDDNIYLSDVYYYYITRLDPFKKDDVYKKLRVLLDKIQMIREMSFRMLSI